ncbi:MAG: hypothetical protein H0X25_17575 [Acidobacteriales bacterium]|nr:hypothetical protein [Terriglobales bacterium]
MGTIRTLAAVLMALSPFALGQGTYTQIDYPGGTCTAIFGINNSGDVVGYYAANSAYHGFLLSKGSYTTIDYPGAPDTYLLGINDQGQVVGEAVNPERTGTVGIVYDMATQMFSKSGSFPNAYTVFSAINNAGAIVGAVEMAGSTNDIGFELVDDTYSELRSPALVSVSPNAINSSGESIGNAVNSLGTGVNFLFHGDFQRSGIPNEIAYASGINDAGAIAGYYYPNTSSCDGFLYQNGIFQPLSFPGSTDTIGRAVNNANAMVGYFNIGSVTHGFLYIPEDGTRW